MSERNSSGSTISLEGSTTLLCSSAARNPGILVQRLKILSPLDNTPIGFFYPLAAAVLHEVTLTDEAHQEELGLSSVFKETKSLGTEVLRSLLNVSMMLLLF